MSLIGQLLRAGISSNGIDLSIFKGRLDLHGRSYKPGATTTVRVHLRDNAGMVLLASGTSVPSSEAGYAKGGIFLKTNVSGGSSGFYTNSGTTSSCTFSLVDLGTIAASALDPTLIQYATVNITNSQIKNLRATPKLLVAAQGAGTLVEMLSVVLELKAGVSVLTESTANLAVRYTGTTGAIVSQTVEATGFIDQAVDTITVALPKIDPIVASSAGLNKTLVLHNLGAGEYAGNADNDATIIAKVTYRVHNTL